MRETGKIALEGTAGLSYTLWTPDALAADGALTMVVFISGLLTGMSDWEPLATALTAAAPALLALSYDRWNCGASDALPAARTHNDIATSAADAAALVRGVCAAHGLPGAPRLRVQLVCSSIGCSVARVWAARQQHHAVAVAGAVLLDPYMSDTDFASLFPRAAAGEPEALTRTRARIVAAFHPGVPNREGLDRGTARALLPDAARPPWPGAPPLCVVAHDPGFTADDMVAKMGIDRAVFLRYVQTAWDAHNRGLASLSPRGRVVVAERAGHFVHRDRPDLVLKTVLDMYAEIR